MKHRWFPQIESRSVQIRREQEWCGLIPIVPCLTFAVDRNKSLDLWRGRFHEIEHPCDPLIERLAETFAVSSGKQVGRAGKNQVHRIIGQRTHELERIGLDDSPPSLPRQCQVDVSHALTSTISTRSIE